MGCFELKGKIAVVTGAASGIGLAIAKRFAENGARVLMLDLEAEKLDRAVQEIASGNARTVKGILCDVTQESSVAAAFAQIDGAVEILVNCAGIAHVGNLQTTTVSDMDRLFAVNVRGTYLCMRSAIQQMVAAKRGVILNLASIAATRAVGDRFAYSMTKGAVLSMTLSVAQDYIDDGVRCNCLSPARVHTPFVDGFLAKNYPGREAEQMKVLAAAQPIGRMGTPEEIAACAHYLCSDEASFLTGVDYPIDGGFMNLR